MSPMQGSAYEQMPAYERARWDELNAYWVKRANARGTPKWISEGTAKAAQAVGAVGHQVEKVAPESAKRAVEQVGGTLLIPAFQAAAALLKLTNDWAVELHDPARVIALARKHDLDVSEIADLRTLALSDCDRLLGHHALKWRTFGAAEGAAMGALAMVPVAGIPVSITADILVMDVLCTSIATRVAYSYGFDARNPEERQFIETVVATGLTKQLTKAAPLNHTGKAGQAFHGRQRWSNKLRQDHPLGAELEKFMARWYKGGKVPVQHVGKSLWALAILVGAGTNSQTLARVAEHSQKYCQTRWLCQNHGLELPPALRGNPPPFDDVG